MKLLEYPLPKHSVYVRVDLKVEGDIYSHGIDVMQKMEKENKELKERITRLENVMGMLWYAPNMPGYQEAELSWKSKVTTS